MDSSCASSARRASFRFSTSGFFAISIVALILKTVSLSLISGSAIKPTIADSADNPIHTVTP